MAIRLTDEQREEAVTKIGRIYSEARSLRYGISLECSDIQKKIIRSLVRDFGATEANNLVLFFGTLNRYRVVRHNLWVLLKDKEEIYNEMLAWRKP